jgi:flagellar motor switch protein FliN
MAQPALVRPIESSDQHDWQSVGELKCAITLELPLAHFCVRDLVELRPGTVVETRWAAGKDVPIKVNQQLIAWSEFEVLGEQLAVRVTEFA